MIYMQAGDERILILDPTNLEDLRMGIPLKSPDGEVRISYTPDIEWLSEQIVPMVKDRQISMSKLDEVTRQSMDRAVKYSDPEKPIKRII